MVYEHEISIFNEDALKNKFKSVDTQFDVVLGKISAIISDSEIENYLDGHTTMNTRLSSTIQDLDGVHTQVSSMQTEYRDGIDGLKTRVSSAELKITDSAIISTVTNTEDGKTALNSVIDQRADSIRLKADKISWESAYSSMTEDGLLTCTGGNIAGWNVISDRLYKTSSYTEGTATTQYFAGMFASNDVTGSKYAFAVEERNYDGSSFDVWKTNFCVRYDGKMYAENAEIKGKITATSGYIGTADKGFVIGSSSIYNGISSLSATSGDGVFFGTAGINIGGGKFVVTKTGLFSFSNQSLVLKIGRNSSDNPGLVRSGKPAIYNFSPGLSLTYKDNDKYGIAFGLSKSTGAFYIKINSNSPFASSYASNFIEHMSHNIFTTDSKTISHHDYLNTSQRFFEIYDVDGDTQRAQHNWGVSQFAWQTYEETSTWFRFDSTGLVVNGTKVFSSSSKRYKHNIGSLSNNELSPHKLLYLEPKQFIYNDGKEQYPDTKGIVIPGFIAEDVAEIYPSAVIHNQDGEVESWDERRIIPGMLALIQELYKKLDNIERRLS